MLTQCKQQDHHVHQRGCCERHKTGGHLHTYSCSHQQYKSNRFGRCSRWEIQMQNPVGIPCSLRASSPIWASEASLARTREWGAEERRACNHPLQIFISTPETPGLRKAWKLSPQTCRRLQSDNRLSSSVELFIYKSLSQQHQGNVFNHWYVFFFTGTSNFNVSARIRTHYFDSLLRLPLKSRPYCSVEDYSPSQSPTRNYLSVWNWRIAFSCTWFS